MGEILVGFGCVAYSFMPDVGLADVGHKRRKKAKEIKRWAALLTSFFFRLPAHLFFTPDALCAGVGDLGKWRLAL